MISLQRPLQGLRQLASSRKEATPREQRAGGAEKGPFYLVSMASWPNYGDELITRAWLRYLAERHPQRTVWLDVREPGLASSLFAADHPRLRVTNTLFRAIHEHLAGDPRSPAQKIRELGSPKYDLGLLDLRSASSLHLLGGGYINRVWPQNQLLAEAFRAVKEISGARLYASGQGLMPHTGEDFRDFDHLSVRDRPSAEALGIAPGLDDAFLAPEAVKKQDDSSEPLRLYLCVQNDALDPGAHRAMLDYVRDQVKTLGIAREETYYLEAIPGDDHAGYAALKDLVAPDGFIPFAHFWRSKFSFSPRQVWISSRFHHHLQAAAAGARGIALSGKLGYYDVKHSSIQELGSGWKLVTPLEEQGAARKLYSLEQLDYPADFSPYRQAKKAEAAQLYPPGI